MNETIRQLLRQKPITANKLAHKIAGKTGQHILVVNELVLKELRDINPLKTNTNGVKLYRFE